MYTLDCELKLIVNTYDNIYLIAIEITIYI
jgi:hypothetical protein